MEKASQSTLSHSLFFAETVTLLFLNTILAWLTKFHKLSSQLLSCSSREEHRGKECTQSMEERGDHYSLLISREELEVIMGGLGLDYSATESEQLTGGMDDIRTMFEEKEPSLEEVRAAFAVFDQNSDGFIDAEELQRVLSVLGIGGELVAMESCEEMIEAHDGNRDGRIDFDEFVKFMESSFC